MSNSSTSVPVWAGAVKRLGAGGRGDTPDVMRRVVAEGVDLIETDHPEVLLEVLAEVK
jgi:hypothetical protein